MRRPTRPSRSGQARGQPQTSGRSAALIWPVPIARQGRRRRPNIPLQRSVTMARSSRSRLTEKCSRSRARRSSTTICSSLTACPAAWVAQPSVRSATSSMASSTVIRRCRTATRSSFRTCQPCNHDRRTKRCDDCRRYGSYAAQKDDAGVGTGDGVMPKYVLTPPSLWMPTKVAVTSANYPGDSGQVANPHPEHGDADQRLETEWNGLVPRR